ncbi:MAG: OadG family protein [Bacteroidales bacterium]|nr:OadG family protein [Bacteroidales bacterium]
MDNIGIGLMLMLVGMITVFVILLIVIYGSRLLIRLINKIAPEEVPAASKKDAKDDNAAVRPILEAAVAQITGGKGHIVNIKKI